jgi:hypothetical protein
VVKKKPLERKIKMTRQITPEENRIEENAMEFQSLRKRIAELNSYQAQPRVDIKLITAEHAVGREYLGTMFDKVEQNRIYGGFEDTLLDNRLFDKITEKITSLRSGGRKPEAFSIDAFCAVEWTNYNREYAYMINFYGGRAR